MFGEKTKERISEKPKDGDVKYFGKTRFYYGKWNGEEMWVAGSRRI